MLPIAGQTAEIFWGHSGVPGGCLRLKKEYFFKWNYFVFREETLKNENVEKGKIIPRSFEPPAVSSPSVGGKGFTLPSNKININTVENSEIIGDTGIRFIWDIYE